MKHNKKMRQAIQQGKQHQQATKPKPCLACNGSGRYDHNGSPKCGACNGTGKDKP